jgi:hypothetical protein
MNFVALGMVLSDRFAALVRWMKNEPIVVRVLAALATTALAKWGVQLDGDQVLAVGAVAAGIAAWAARRKVDSPATVRDLTAAAADRGRAEGAAVPKRTRRAASESGAVDVASMLLGVLVGLVLVVLYVRL